MDKFNYIIGYEKYSDFQKENTIKITRETNIRIAKLLDDNINFECCDYEQGCCFSIDNNNIFICHFHLFELLDIFHEIVEEMQDYQTALVEFMSQSIVVNKSKAIYIRKEILNYLYTLYISDRDSVLFTNTILSANQKEVINGFAKRHEREMFENHYLSQAHIGEVNSHRINKEIIGKLQDCVHYNKILYYSEEEAKENPVTNLKVYSSMRNILCKAVHHKNRFHTVITILDDRNDNFAFGFCQNCLYDFYIVLKSAYEKRQIKVHKHKEFMVMKCESNEPCFFTGVHESVMYRVCISNVSFYLCRSSFEMLFETIINSTVFKELFPNESGSGSLVLKNNEKWYTEHYEKIINDLNIQLQVEKNRNEQITYNNKVLKREVRQLNKKISEQENEMKGEPKQRVDANVCNCLLRSNSMNLSIKRKDAQNSKTPKFKITYIYGADCATIDHFPKSDYGIILEIERENEKFCFELCETCIKYINQGLSAILSKKKDFINDFVKYKIVPIRNADTHCYKCGGKHPVLYQISFANVNFTLCINCIRKLSEQLTEASDRISVVKKLGGIDFLKNGVIDLTK